MEYLENNKWKVASVGIVILACFLVWGYIIPELQQAVQLYSNLQEKKAEVASVQNWQHRLKRLNNQQKKLENYLSKIFLNLPENDQMSTIVDQVFKEAKSGDVRILQMRPTDRIHHKGYLEIPISMRVQGSFHDIGRFINNVERSKYLMKVERVKIMVKDSSTSPLIAQLVLKVIILKRNEKPVNTDA